ncbi:MAG: acyl-CoA dehydrogenase family protein, partial [Alphaproteobacteria bacterium]
MSDLVMEFGKTAARLGAAAKHDHPGIWQMESLPDGLWDAFGQSGLLGLSAPVAFGGAGLSVDQIARVARQFSKAAGVQGLSTLWQSHNLMADWIFGHFANTAQQAEWWPKIATGAATASFAVSEAGAGAHPKKLSARAIREGDGWRLDGGKAYVTNGPIATVFVVVAVVGETSGRKRFGAFLVPRDAEGLTIRPSEHVEYLKPSGHASLNMAGVYVPDAARLTDADDVYPIMVKPLRDHEDAAGAWSPLGAYEGLATAFARNEDTVIIGGGIAARLH